MTRKEAIRQTHQEDTLRALGFTSEEAEQLRRISMTLRRWFEHECNGDIQRDEQTDKPYCHYGHDDRRYPVADRETGARKRLLAIVNARAKRMGVCDVTTYVQTDPRGAALYVIRKGDVPEGADVSSYYSRGICIY